MKSLLVDQFLLQSKNDAYLEKLAFHLRRCKYLYYAVWGVFFVFGGHLVSVILLEDWSENTLFVGGVLLFCLLVFLWRYAQLLSLQKSAFDYWVKERIFPQILEANNWTIFSYKERENYEHLAKNTLEKIEKMGLRWIGDTLSTYLKDRFLMFSYALIFVIVFNIVIGILLFLLFGGYPLVVVLLGFCVYLLLSEPLKYGMFRSDFWFFSHIEFFKKSWDRMSYYLQFANKKSRWSFFEISRLPWWYLSNSSQEKLAIHLDISQTFGKGFYLKLIPRFIKKSKLWAFLKLFLLLCCVLVLIAWVILFILATENIIQILFRFLFCAFFYLFLSSVFDFTKLKERFLQQKVLVFWSGKQIKPLFSLDFHECYEIISNDEFLAHTFLNPAVKEVLMRLYQESEWKYSFYVENHHFYWLKHLKNSQKLTPFNYQNPKDIGIFCEHLAEFLMLSKVIK